MLILFFFLSLVLLWFQVSNLLEDKSDSYVGGTRTPPKALKVYKTIAADGTEEEVSEGGQLEVRPVCWRYG